MEWRSGRGRGRVAGDRKVRRRITVAGSWRVVSGTRKRTRKKTRTRKKKRKRKTNRKKTRKHKQNQDRANNRRNIEIERKRERRRTEGRQGSEFCADGADGFERHAVLLLPRLEFDLSGPAHYRAAFEPQTSPASGFAAAGADENFAANAADYADCARAQRRRLDCGVSGGAAARGLSRIGSCGGE